VYLEADAGGVAEVVDHVATITNMAHKTQSRPYKTVNMAHIRQYMTVKMAHIHERQSRWHI